LPYLKNLENKIGQIMKISNTVSQGRFNYPQTEARIYRKYFRRAQTEMERSGQLILGSGVSNFEAKFAKWIGNGISSDQVIGVATGTDALELALRSCGIKPSQKVALPSHTAYGTVAAILRLGAVPVFIDIGIDSSTICPIDLKKRLETFPEIKAVIAVHLYGESCELDSLLKICKEFSISLIEDCAQSFGTFYKGKSVGTFGDRSAFSFYPTKNLAAMGDAGLFIANTSDDALVFSRRLRFYGWDNSREAVQEGVNSRIDEIQARLLSAKLLDIDKRISQRRNVAKIYQSQLEHLREKMDILSLPSDGINWSHSYHLYVIRVNSKYRNLIAKYCIEKGIPVGIHYPKACHQQSFLSTSRYRLKNTEKFVEQILSLPINPYLKERDIKKVSNILKESIKSAKNEGS
tara:strand:+ start:848 stop:2065 length:1218 start_codon:yes stop_codon:yes gene_type:complete